MKLSDTDGFQEQFQHSRKQLLDHDWTITLLLLITSDGLVKKQRTT
jgi:hypothetical protein